MVAVLLTMPARFRGRDAYWFIDNVAALSGFIRGNSEASDVDRAAAVAAMFAALLQTRVWFEYVRMKVFPFGIVVCWSLLCIRVECADVFSRQKGRHSQLPTRVGCGVTVC